MIELGLHAMRDDHLSCSITLGYQM